MKRPHKAEEGARISVCTSIQKEDPGEWVAEPSVTLLVAQSTSQADPQTRLEVFHSLQDSKS